MKVNTCDSDKVLIAEAKQALAQGRFARFNLLGFSLLMLGFSGWFNYKVIVNLESLDPTQVSEGFIKGFVLAIKMSTFGIIGALSFLKFIIGLAPDHKVIELLVRTHDELENLKRLQRRFIEKGRTDNKSK